MPMEIRLAKAIAQAGIASRRAAEKLIFDGKVRINGKVECNPATHVDVSTDQIAVNNVLVNGVEKKVYYLLNKPKGYICSRERLGNKKIVYDLFSAEYRLFTVGRLDRDTTGLLIVTNDGHFANQVIHPSSNITKEYLVKVDSFVTDEDIKTIAKGTRVEGEWIRPKQVVKVRKGTIKVVVKEGKKREVRYLVENAGLTILSLERIRIGGLQLPNIPEGCFRDMTENEKNAIFGL